MYLYNSLGGLLLDQPFDSCEEQEEQVEEQEEQELEEQEELVEEVEEAEQVLLLVFMENPLSPSDLAWLPKIPVLLVSTSPP